MTTTTEAQPENRSEAAATGHGGHKRPSYDDVNVPVVFLVGLISMILTFLTIWFVEGVFYRWQNGLVQERSYDVVNPIQAGVIEGQKAVLAGDEERNISSFEAVIDDVVARYRNDSETPAADDDNAGEDAPDNGEAGH